MTEREKVIKGLECSIGIRGCKNCDDCPYDNDFNCIGCDIVLRDAIALLKAQEPRVLSLEEVRDEYEVVWLETKYLQPTVCLVDNGESDADWLYVVFGVDDCHPMPCRFYGKGWRCWSAKPTEEQMEAIPWEK